MGERPAHRNCSLQPSEKKSPRRPRLQPQKSPQRPRLRPPERGPLPKATHAVCHHDGHKLFAAGRAARLSCCCVLSVKPNSEDMRLLCICLHLSLFGWMPIGKKVIYVSLFFDSDFLNAYVLVECIIGSDQFFFVALLMRSGLKLDFGSVDSQQDFLDVAHPP